MRRPRLLIPITIHFGVRYLVRTGLLQQLSAYADPIVLLGWADEALRAELRADGVEVYALPGARWGREYERVRGRINVWHRGRIASPSTRIDERRNAIGSPLKERLVQRAYRLLHQSRLLLPGRIAALRQAEQGLLLQDTNIAEYRRLIGGIRPDAVFCLTPYLRDEELLLRACAEAGIPLSTAILSFDNITTRGWISVLFDWYMLWNAHNARELRRIYPESADRAVTIVGAPQFDFYRDPSYIWPEPLWRERLALPPDRPVLLFGGGFHTIVPHEPDWLAQLDDAIERGEIAGRPVILFRRHPVDPVERWQPVLVRARNVVYDDPWRQGHDVGRMNISRADIEKLASTLHHSRVHVNASSTMTVDGAIFDRPQIGPAYDDRPGRVYDRAMRELYEREHYLPITRSGGLEIVYSRDEMIAAVNSAMRDPRRRHDGRRQMVREICSFDDGRSTVRVNDALQRFLVKSGSGHDPAPADLVGAQLWGS